MPEPQHPQRRRRAGATAAIVLVLVAAAAACSSSTVETDPTTTVQAMTGTLAPDEDEPGGADPGTTIDDGPRTGTSLIDEPEDPPTGDETEQEYIDALVATFEEDPDQIFTREDVECLAAAWVPAIGVEAFQAAGVTPADLASGDAGIDDVVIDRSTGEDIVDAIPGCGMSLRELFLDTLGPDVARDPVKVACLETAVTDDQIREALIADLMGAEADDPEDLAASCLS